MAGSGQKTSFLVNNYFLFWVEEYADIYFIYGSSNLKCYDAYKKKWR
jgi:hypothetical protein